MTAKREKPTTRTGELIRVNRSYITHHFTHKGIQYKLTAKEKTFTDFYLATFRRVDSVIYGYPNTGNSELYYENNSDLSPEKKILRKKMINTCIHVADEILNRPHVQAYIDKFLSEHGFTEERVRLEHFNNITNPDAPAAAKNQAIDMFYKLKNVYPGEKSKSELDEELAKALAVLREKVNDESSKRHAPNA
jgi:hypothetical protein